jgi:hypothetical protein
MKLSRVDTIKILGYVISGLGLLTASTLHLLLDPWHISSVHIESIAGQVGSVLLATTLVYSVIKKQTPDGNPHTVYSPTATVDPATLTTGANLKGPTT